MKNATLSSIAAVLTLVLLTGTAQAAGIFLLKDFRLHNFDSGILASLGFTDGGSITYFRELGAITSNQQQTREKYEVIGCHEFYVMRNGKVEEEGTNCGTFYCVGYVKGPKVCRDTAGKAYGGVVEINRRLGIPPPKLEQVNFSAFPESDKTAAMRSRDSELRKYRCTPFYLRKFDTMVGEGYTCEEVGQYPYFSVANVCQVDWRTGKVELQCEQPQRSDEFAIRKQAIEIYGGGDVDSGTGSLASSTGSSLSSQSSVSSSASGSLGPAFPDILEGKYGFTAVNDLAQRGIIRGYADGTFRPQNAVNRAEFMKVLLGGLFAGELKGETGCFPDVHDEWFAPYVCAAKRLGWVSGYPDGTFRPAQTIRKEEAIKIVVASLNLPLDSGAVLPQGVPTGAWYTPFVRKAVELKIILESSLQVGVEASRADTAVWLYRALKVVPQ